MDFDLSRELGTKVCFVGVVYELQVEGVGVLARASLLLGWKSDEIRGHRVNGP